MNTSLSLQAQTISLEALSGEHALKQAITRLPHYFTEVKSFLHDRIGSPVADFFTKSDLLKFAEKASKLNYADLRALPVAVPPGLKVDYATYAQALNEAAPVAFTLRESILKPFSTYLATTLANPQNLASKAPLNAGLDAKKLNIQPYVKGLEKCFETHRREGTLPYGKAFKRNSDWVPVARTALSLQEGFGKDDYKELVREINHASDLLDQLIVRLNEDPDTYKASGQTIAGLASTAYAIAREAEFYGILRYKVEVFEVSLRQVKDKLKPML